MTPTEARDRYGATHEGNTTMKYTIFSIDGEDNPDARRLIEHMFKHSSVATGTLVPCVGVYKGVKEHAYICNSTSFDAFVQPMGFVANQESVLRVSGCNKQYTVLEFLDGRTQRWKHLGCMTSVTREEAEANGDYTWRPMGSEAGTYWIATAGNNDKAYVKMYRFGPTGAGLTETEARHTMIRALVKHYLSRRVDVWPIISTIGSYPTDVLITKVNSTHRKLLDPVVVYHEVSTPHVKQLEHSQKIKQGLQEPSYKNL
jgi:hypothetical protein